MLIFWVALYHLLHDVVKRTLLTVEGLGEGIVVEHWGERPEALLVWYDAAEEGDEVEVDEHLAKVEYKVAYHDENMCVCGCVMYV